MNVSLLSHTPDALNLLLRTKNTRLGHDIDPATWTDDQRNEHLAYMLDTIRSSWEFVDYVFEIVGASRAFTHQLVRTRSGSYAQESQRTVDVSENGFLPMGGAPWPFRDHAVAVYDLTCAEAFQAYTHLLDMGVPAQDARGVLPTATLTSIICKFNLRTLSDMAKVRLCTRTQGEYQDVFRAMRAAVLAVHPWAKPFINVQCAATGTCAFPRYGKKECKFWDERLDKTAVAQDIDVIFWASERQEATPVARGGMSS